MHARPSNMKEDPLFYLDKVKGHNSGLHNISSILRVESYGKDGAKKGKALLAASRKPMRIQIEAKSPTDDFISLFVVGSNRFVFFERGGDSCYTGIPCPSNLAKFLPVSLDLQGLTGLFFWNFPLIEHTESRVDFDAKSGLIVLTLKNDIETEEIYFSPKDMLPSAMKYRGKNRTEYTLIGSGMKELEKGIVIPLVINYRSSADGSDVTVKFRDIIYNTAMEAGELLECPPGLKESILPCED